jgi:hypothetical protein
MLILNRAGIEVLRNSQVDGRLTYGVGEGGK